ncbi:hypothetical protein QE152_g12680 [Popillia japonica]
MAWKQQEKQQKQLEKWAAEIFDATFDMSGNVIFDIDDSVDDANYSPSSDNTSEEEVYPSTSKRNKTNSEVIYISKKNKKSLEEEVYPSTSGRNNKKGKTFRI